jgi:hypothetical protein
LLWGRRTAWLHGGFGRLIKQATPTGSKFVIFIDDLDRCKPPRGADVLEAVNQLLDHSGVVVVVMSDMQVVARSVEIKYKDFALLESAKPSGGVVSGCSKYGWNFIQKIIQLQFDLPSYSTLLIRRMVEDLAKQVPRQPLAGQFSTLIYSVRAYAKAAVKRISWEDVWETLWGLAVLLAVTLTVIFIVGGKLRMPLSLMDKITLGLGAFVLGSWVDGRIIRLLKLLRESKRRGQIDEQIRERIAHGDHDFARVEGYVRARNSSRSDDREIEGLVRERVQRYLEDESEFQREAADEVMRYLEPMPRHAKRLLNRLRLLLFIAHARHMFGGEPKLSARHIGKWAVLGERWPELFQMLCNTPFHVYDLEDDNVHDSWVKSHLPIYEGDLELRQFFLTPEGAKLSTVIVRLVTFAPA